jgi:hypothetical protein
MRYRDQEDRCSVADVMNCDDFIGVLAWTCTCATRRKYPDPVTSRPRKNAQYLGSMRTMGAGNIENVAIAVRK